MSLLCYFKSPVSLKGAKGAKKTILEKTQNMITHKTTKKKDSKGPITKEKIEEKTELVIILISSPSPCPSPACGRGGEDIKTPSYVSSGQDIFHGTAD